MLVSSRVFAPGFVHYTGALILYVCWLVFTHVAMHLCGLEEAEVTWRLERVVARVGCLEVPKGALEILGEWFV